MKQPEIAMARGWPPDRSRRASLRTSGSGSIGVLPIHEDAVRHLGYRGMPPEQDHVEIACRIRAAEKERLVIAPAAHDQ